MINLLSGFSELRTFPLPSVSLVVLTCSGSQQILLPGGYCLDASPDLAPWNEQTSWCAYSTTCDGIFAKDKSNFLQRWTGSMRNCIRGNKNYFFIDCSDVLVAEVMWDFFFFTARDIQYTSIGNVEWWLHDHNYRMPQACACEWAGHANVKILKWCWISHHHGLFPGGPLSVRDLPPKSILTLSNSLKIEMCLLDTLNL